MPATTDPREAARAAELRYVEEDDPGITRRRRGRGLSYALGGQSVTSASDRERIARLAVPPAWTDVWICPDDDGHIQATGRDDAGRKQYRYHDRWQVIRDLDKFTQLAIFGARLPTLRRQVALDLDRQGLPQERVLALVVRLLDQTLIRIGSPQYATRESFGLTTLESRHVEIEGSDIVFAFAGKSGVEHQLAVADRKLASLIERCDEQSGDQLFVYVDGGETQAIRSDDVNDYLRAIAGPDVTARDFRTWGGSVAVARHLAPLDPHDGCSADQVVLEAIDEAASLLGNTRAVCRSSYVHPEIVTAFKDGRLRKAWRSSRRTPRMLREERTTLRILRPAAACTVPS